MSFRQGAPRHFSLFGHCSIFATAAWEWTGLGVLMTHGWFAQQVFESWIHCPVGSIAGGEFARRALHFAPIRHPQVQRTLKQARRELATMWRKWWRKWLDRYLRLELIALIIIFLMVFVLR